MSRPKKKNIWSSKPATKGDIEQLREDVQADLVNHTYSKEELDVKFEQNKQEIIREFWSSVEDRAEKLQGAHEDELASVEGRKDAPAQWKSMPRRLKAVEMDVEKIKDHLEIG